MQVQVGDRFTDESGTWEVTTRPTAWGGGKTVHLTVRRLDDPMSPARDVMWPAFQRVEVVRTLEGLPPTSPPKRPAKRKGRDG